MSFKERLAHGFNAFMSVERPMVMADVGPSYTVRPDRTNYLVTNERSIVTSIYNRIATDAAAVDIRHVRLDENDRFIGEIDSGLNNCLKVEANIDQAATAFKQDIVATVIEKGVAALVPVDTSLQPGDVTGSYDILTMRVGEIIQWFPRHVRVSLYNEARGRREELLLEKRHVGIVENPFYNVMNAPNSTLQRLIRKLGLLDAIDEQAGSGKMDLIIQLPYTIRSETKRDQAEKRRRDIEYQLKDSKYGIAYADATEKITQLNRPIENNMLKQVEYLTNLLYGQLGLTPEILNGSADEKTMLNYQQRTVKPILRAIVEAMRRSFLTKTARTQRQSIMYFRDPFELVPVSDLAEIADKFTRNEILSSNEIRQFIGIKPATDPRADQLRNSNMPQSELGMANPNAGYVDPNADPNAPLDPNADPNAPLQVESERVDPNVAAQSATPAVDFDMMDQIMNEVFDSLSNDIDAYADGDLEEDDTE